MAGPAIRGGSGGFSHRENREAKAFAIWPQAQNALITACLNRADIIPQSPKLIQRTLPVVRLTLYILAPPKIAIRGLSGWIIEYFNLMLPPHLSTVSSLLRSKKVSPWYSPQVLVLNSTIACSATASSEAVIVPPHKAPPVFTQPEIDNAIKQAMRFLHLFKPFITLASITSVSPNHYKT